MLEFRRVRDPLTNEVIMETSLSGKPLLTTPQLNKDTAFTEQERRDFGLSGKLPAKIETLDQQVDRVYHQFLAYNHRINRNIYLNSLHDRNQVLFYKLVSEHLGEMIPVIYTPIVGNAVKQFSQSFRQPRGLYISYPEMDRMEELLQNRSNPEIDLIVVTDGEGVLGIGDQGIGGMDIPVAKLMVYTLCGGIDPNRTLPILLDVGTNNETLLEDPMYLGWRHRRLDRGAYDEFIARFINAVEKLFPKVFLHWEDFGRENARRNLDLYRSKVCTFNDDMQGTGVVTLSALLAGVKANNSKLTEQRIVVFGAGTAGTGIADQIRDAMVHEGLSREEANQRFYLLDRPGLLTQDMEQLTDFQRDYARDPKELTQWNIGDRHYINLYDVVHNAKPTILIGCSAVPGAFHEKAIKEMAKHCQRPIVLPLSNPTEQVEATPEDLIRWTNGKVLIATGSPFDPVEFADHQIEIAQCNNALVFPGIGLGLVTAKAAHLSDECLWVACKALSEFAPITKDPYGPLLPNLDHAREVSYHIAIAVIKQLIKEGVTQLTLDQNIPSLVKHQMWEPSYLPYRRI